jgi:diguanylate cyclase (GGDEF)-like protein/PAS domain S-box-containing protein
MNSFTQEGSAATRTVCQAIETRPQGLTPNGRASLAESVLDNLKEVVFQTDAQGYLEFLNPAWEELSGQDVGSSLGRYSLDFVHPADRERKRELLRPLVTGERECCRQEMRYLRNGSELRWVEVFARAIVGRDGVVTGIAGTLNDISERKAADERLRLAASVFANAGEGIMITSPKGEIVDVNTAFEAITGYPREEVIGRNPRVLSSGRQDGAFYARMWESLQREACWQGEVWNRRKNGEFYVERLTITTILRDDGSLSNYIGIFSDITSQKRQAEHLEHIAHYDPLTGLPNRRLLADRLQQSMARARRSGSSVAVAYLDLDGFKTVNDRYGHEYGDELLVVLGQRIRAVVRECDTACRLGGDEFVVVFDSIDCIEDCRPMMERLLEAVARPVHVGQVALGVTGSAGISLYPQEDDIDADQLMRQADQAMYQAKLAGKNRFCVFDSLHYRTAVDRNEQIAGIRRALDKDEFVLHYQPIVNLRSGELNSVEALIRWEHPVRGCLGPAEFLPAIEGHAVMLDLENWVLEEAMCQHERWLDAGLDIAISVNMSGIQLHQDDFVRQLGRMLECHPRVKPRNLKLEVLESSALVDMQRVSRLISECSELGVSFALDDFGTGYSSLSYLKQLPAKRIKIDHGFVRDMLEDPDDLAILEGVIGMAAAFKREVIAEGVESIRHAQMLVQLGCVLGQGFGIARPMPAQALPGWLAQWRLPQELADCAVLEREDTLLLKAIVEHRAWRLAFSASFDSADWPLYDGGIAGMRILDRWIALGGAKQQRCQHMIAEVMAVRDTLQSLVDDMLGGRARGEPRNAELECRLDRVADALSGLLERLVES